MTVSCATALYCSLVYRKQASVRAKLSITTAHTLHVLYVVAPNVPAVCTSTIDLVQCYGCLGNKLQVCLIRSYNLLKFDFFPASLNLH